MAEDKGPSEYELAQRYGNEARMASEQAAGRGPSKRQAAAERKEREQEKPAAEPDQQQAEQPGPEGRSTPAEKRQTTSPQRGRQHT
jgi:hypothetical protein